MDEKLLALPIGIQSFDKLRRENYLYVDKTAKLQELITNGSWYFLSRPRRFGKSLTLSTLDAMFRGRAELFKGLAAESWVQSQIKQPSPVLRLDMAHGYLTDNVNNFEKSLYTDLMLLGNRRGLSLARGEAEGVVGVLKDILEGLYEQSGPVVVLIDEYDKPILDNIGDLRTAEAMRRILRAFYTALKSCDEYLRFVMLTGISKFSKTGVFSAMNNLQDISMNKRYGDVVGYTQSELEANFHNWLNEAMKALSIDRNELLNKIRNYYDGFCFDGEVWLYNPFSILNFFSEQEFNNYWYTSGSPTFIVTYMRQHGVQDPEEYRHIEVPKDFASAHEIEYSTPESFLYQSGYLTIEKKKEDTLILDYPNYEVKKSLVRMYLDGVYHVKEYVTLGGKLWKALSGGNVMEIVQLYDIALAGIPYDDFPNRDEFWYRSLFLMLLRGAGIIANGEIHTNRGRPDIVVQFTDMVIVLEFKLAKDSSDIDKMRKEGEQQIEEKKYAKFYEAENRKIITAVVIIDGEKNEAVL